MLGWHHHCHKSTTFIPCLGLKDPPPKFPIAPEGLASASFKNSLILIPCWREAGATSLAPRNSTEEDHSTVFSFSHNPLIFKPFKGFWRLNPLFSTAKSSGIWQHPGYYGFPPSIPQILQTFLQQTQQKLLGCHKSTAFIPGLGMKEPLPKFPEGIWCSRGSSLI